MSVHSIVSADVSEGVNSSYYANVLHMRIILVANSSYYTNVFHIPTAHNDGNSVCIETSVTHSAAPRVPLLCSYHILTSSVTHY